MAFGEFVKRLNKIVKIILFLIFFNPSLFKLRETLFLYSCECSFLLIYYLVYFTALFNVLTDCLLWQASTVDHSGEESVSVATGPADG